MFANDRFVTEAGELEISFIGHGTLMMTLGKTVIHVDPVAEYADYGGLPKADLVLVTHDHYDHLDLAAIQAIRTDRTSVVCSAKCADQLRGANVMRNGDRKKLLGIEIEAVPAYNQKHMKPDGKPFHPRGEGNGYVLAIGGLRVYVAGDTENIPEMKALKNIDVAFLPMNLPYTMTVEMVADAARAFKPKVLYPYHTGDTQVQKLAELLAGEKGIEVRIRALR